MNIRNAERCYIVAEIGVNHGGSVDLAYSMIDAAKRSGADAVKFQTFKASSLVGLDTPKVTYQISTTDKKQSHFEMIQSLEFKYEDHKPVFKYCQEHEIDFISTPYDVESAMFLHDLGIQIFKTASADIVDLPLHEFLASTGKNVIISTGMATLGEIEKVVSIYQKADISKVALLHCVANYPCSYQSLNLNVLNTLANTFNVPVGFSDHAIGPIPAVAAVALGAKIIEKHFTLDKEMEGPDHKASSTPEEFIDLVESVRTAEKSLGHRVKHVQEEELEMRKISRKSIVLLRDIKKGELIGVEDLALKRPGFGLYADKLKAIIGAKAQRDLSSGCQIVYGDFG